MFDLCQLRPLAPIFYRIACLFCLVALRVYPRFLLSVKDGAEFLPWSRDREQLNNLGFSGNV
jgi:hypothetical protein